MPSLAVAAPPATLHLHCDHFDHLLLSQSLWQHGVHVAYVLLHTFPFTHISLRLIRIEQSFDESMHQKSSANQEL